MSFSADLDEIVARNENGLLSAHPSWCRVMLGDITSILNGFPFDSRFFGKSTGAPLIRIRDILGETTDVCYAGPIPEGYWVSRGDLLVGMDGDFNRSRWRGELALLNQRVCRLTPDLRFINASFLFHALGGYLSAINASTPSITVKHLSSRTVSAVPLPYPPMAEQKRIADKLDAVVARVDVARARLHRVPAIIKRFRRAVLTAATGGELTREWRQEHALAGVDWQESTVGQLIQRVEAGLNVQCDERPPTTQERGLLKISAVSWGSYDDDESKTLPAEADVPERSRIRVGDFLISRANTVELVGACVIVEKVTRPVFLSDKVLRLVMADDLKAWILLVLRSPLGRNEIEQRASGNQLSMRNLSQANLRDIPIPLPSADERAEIVRRTQLLLGYADRIERRYDSGRGLLARLTPSLLAKAFRGELIPQDPSDEPAAALVARLRKEKESATPPLRRPRARA